MSAHVVYIDYRFTTLNDYISAERANKYAAANIKKQETEIARLLALDVKPVEHYPIDITFVWFRKDERTDPDNIQFGAKFILDGFVQAGFLKGDNWKYIEAIHHRFVKYTSDCVNVIIQETT